MHDPFGWISCSRGICPSPQLPIPLCSIGDVTCHLVNSFRLSLDNGIVLEALYDFVNLLILVIPRPTKCGCFWQHCFIFFFSGTSAWVQSLSSSCPKRTSMASSSFSCQPHDNSQSCLPDLSGFHSFFRGFDSTGSG